MERLEHGVGYRLGSGELEGVLRLHITILYPVESGGIVLMKLLRKRGNRGMATSQMILKER